MKKEKEMSFIDHLEELRWHIIRSLLAIMVFAIIAFVSKEMVFGNSVVHVVGGHDVQGGCSPLESST